MGILKTSDEMMITWQLQHLKYSFYDRFIFEFKNDKIDFVLNELKDSVLLDTYMTIKYNAIFINMYNVSNLDPLTDIKGNVYPNFHINCTLTKDLNDSEYYIFSLKIDNFLLASYMTYTLQ